MTSVSRAMGNWGRSDPSAPTVSCPAIIGASRGMRSGVGRAGKGELKMTPRIKATLEDILDMAEQREDTRDGADGRPMPNAWMEVAMLCREVLGLGEYKPDLPTHDHPDCDDRCQGC